VSERTGGQKQPQTRQASKVKGRPTECATAPRRARSGGAPQGGGARPEGAGGEWVGLGWGWGGWDVGCGVFVFFWEFFLRI